MTGFSAFLGVFESALGREFELFFQAMNQSSGGEKICILYKFFLL